MVEVLVVNPWSGAEVVKDLSDYTQGRLDAIAGLMDDTIREELHSELAPCEPAVFLAAYILRVGPKKGGVILFS